jgi:hypothetical protein
MAQTLSSACEHPEDGRSRPKANSRTVAGHVPTHLYRKGNIYYFRFALPKHLKDRLGGVEVRLSLRTAYVRKANVLAGKLRDALMANLQGTPMPTLSLTEIKSRLAMLLLESVDAQAGKLETYKNSDALQGMLGVPLLNDPVDAASLRDMARERLRTSGYRSSYLTS